MLTQYNTFGYVYNCSTLAVGACPILVGKLNDVHTNAG